MAKEMALHPMPNDLTTCPTCGCPCTIGGEHTTHYYILATPADVPVKVKELCDAVAEYISKCKCHDHTDDMMLVSMMANLQILLSGTK